MTKKNNHIERLRSLKSREYLVVFAYFVSLALFISAVAIKIRGFFTDGLTPLKITVFEWWFLGGILFFMYCGSLLLFVTTKEELKRIHSFGLLKRIIILLIFFYIL
jgi:hypothetical protein